ncbi:MAG TPA: HgcAB-associated protein [Methanocellaceae archaeon]
MGKKEKDSCCDALLETVYKVESMVAVDERGQMVLPKTIRDKMDIRPGEKLALVTCEKNGKVCCAYLIKNEQLGELVKDIIPK